MIINSTVRPSAHAAPVAVINPGNVAAGTYTTGWVPMAEWGAVLALLQVGTLGAAATVDAKMEQATSAAGAGAKDIAGKDITQLTKAGGDGDQQVLINLFANELDTNNGFAFARLSVTTAVAAVDLSAAVLGFYHRYDSADAGAPVTVAEVVT